MHEQLSTLIGSTGEPIWEQVATSSGKMMKNYDPMDRHDYSPSATDWKESVKEGYTPIMQSAQLTRLLRTLLVHKQLAF